ncbi:hypothetical protein [Chryseobacterium sp. BIGb0232]|uniref:hypothetical protein n=1 Tax=Chryseobacterium sp. BIGb0232 TaxID=2940598 RepID=UPI000F468368|nr:hypothetical protein [Chryseobacterium sp. BIGb0232]MCS4302706.1 hypothetical protein [Chryseobacterium sp. BIGb0232]ROS17360.1 hypothetical protein EDF65_1727 [Chryseobacterium nakagawai]
MRKVLALGLFALVSFNAYAQEDNNTDYELRGDEKYGYIIDKNGKKIEGIVRLNGDAIYPWNNQKKVKFISVSDIDKSKKKQKFKTLDTDDIKEYVSIDESNNERHFENIKYTNTKEGFNTATGGLSGNIKAFNNLTKSNQFAEIVKDGKIKVYKLYGYPTTFSAGTSQMIAADAETKRMRENPSYIYSKKGGKIEEFTFAKAKIIIADCSYAKGKMTSGAYTSLKNDEKKRSGLGKLIKSQIDDVTSNILQIVDEVITDYNENCK